MERCWPLLDTLPLPLGFFDRDMTMRWSNRAFHDLHGRGSERTQAWSWLPPEAQTALRSAVVAAIAGEARAPAAICVELASGQKWDLHVAMVDERVVLGAEGGDLAMVSAVLREGGAGAAAAGATPESTRIDELTGLGDRHALRSELEKAIAQREQGGTRFAVHELDLDHFRRVNDVVGHEQGDRVLRALAARMVELAGAESTVFRIGGDEFAVLQRGIRGPEDVDRLAGRILRSFDESFLLDAGDRIHVRASLGSTLCHGEPCGCTSSGNLLEEAYAALYHAKRAGGGERRRYESALGEAVRERSRLAEALRDAIERDALDLHYQPQIDVTTGEIVGLEALARWDDPTRGRISPAIFVPVAEESGSIAALGAWVLRRVCRTISGWRRQGLVPPRIAVNVSPRELRDPRFEWRVLETLRAHWIDGDAIELELTESFTPQAWLEVRASLLRLRAAGLQLALDDFGTGYSSLLQLRRIPVQKLKIAQDFVRDMMTDAADAAIVRTTVEFGHALGLEVIAEGVETREQLRALRQLGCEQVQGYLIDRPLSEAQMTTRLIDLRDRSWITVTSDRGLQPVAREEPEG